MDARFQHYRIACFLFLTIFLSPHPSHGQIEYVRSAAEKGDAVAQNELARMYALGQGGAPQNSIEAAKWFRRSAAQYYPRSEYNMGLIYATGQGVPKDYVQAAVWYRRAANQGYVRAQRKLGDLYAKGIGVPQDYVEAYKWYNLAAAAGDVEARTERERLTPRMTGEQIARAQRLSTAFKPNVRWRPKK